MATGSSFSDLKSKEYCGSYVTNLVTKSRFHQKVPENGGPHEDEKLVKIVTLWMDYRKTKKRTQKRTTQVDFSMKILYFSHIHLATEVPFNPIQTGVVCY